MGDFAIRAEQLGKQFRLGAVRQKHRTFRDTLSSMVRRPARKPAPGRAERGRPGGRREMFWALREISFDVRSGDVVGVIGPNGSGKSTLLKILSRITEPTEGCAEVRGRVGSLLEVGTGFHPELTGAENIQLSGAILGMRRAEIQRRFDEIVAFAEVEKFVHTPVKHYSSGMYLRLAFAVAAHLEPEVLLVDEVLAVGDIAFQQKCLGKMGSVAREGRTVLFVSHNMGAIVELCSSAILLRQGRLAYSGPVGPAVAMYVEGHSGSAQDEEETSRGVEIPSIRIEGSPTGEIRHDQPFTVCARCVTAEDLPYLRLNLLLFNLRNERVLHLQTDTRALGISRLEAGVHDLRIAVPVLWLAAGAYSAVVKLRVIGSRASDGKVESGHLPVIVSGNTPRFGNLLSPEVSWSLEPAAVEAGVR